MFSSSSSSIFSQRNHLNYNKFFMFYADQVLSLLNPPSPTLIHIKMLSATWKTSYLSYVQFSFVSYRVYIIPYIESSFRKEAGGGSCDTSCTCTPLCISCITSDQLCVSSFLQTLFDSANIRGILPKKKSQTEFNQEYISHNLVYDFRQSTVMNH